VQPGPTQQEPDEGDKEDSARRLCPGERLPGRRLIAGLRLLASGRRAETGLMLPIAASVIGATASRRLA
jgi:hypothetical protein